MGSGVGIGGAVAEHVAGGGEDGGGDGAGRLPRAAPGAQALELGAEVAVLLAHGGPGGLDESGLQQGAPYLRRVERRLRGCFREPGSN